MSLILEALRKSEAERRRGQLPDLHAETAPIASRTTPRVPMRAWMVAALMALSIAVWLLRPSNDDATPATSVDNVSPPASQQSQPARDDATATLPARTPAPAVVATPPAAPVTTPAPASEPPPIVPTSPPPATPAPSQRPETAAPVSRQVPTRPAGAPASDGRVLGLGELDPDTRRALPPLKLSMHLWNEVPSQRFVILDGQRMTEGDRIGDASIVRIERDGVLLDWQGRGIRIPVP